MISNDEYDKKLEYLFKEGKRLNFENRSLFQNQPFDNEQFRDSLTDAIISNSEDMYKNVDKRIAEYNTYKENIHEFINQLKARRKERQGIE